MITRVLIRRVSCIQGGNSVAALRDPSAATVDSADCYAYMDHPSEEAPERHLGAADRRRCQLLKRVQLHHRHLLTTISDLRFPLTPTLIRLTCDLNLSDLY